MKLHNTGSVDVVEDFKIFFGFQSPSAILAGRTVAFLKRYSATFNGVCQLSLSIGHDNFCLAVDLASTASLFYFVLYFLFTCLLC